MVEYDPRSKMADEVVMEIEAEDQRNRERVKTPMRPCRYTVKGNYGDRCGKPFWGVHGGQPHCKDHMPVGQCQAMSQKTGGGTQCEARAESVGDDFCKIHTQKARTAAVYCSRCRSVIEPAHRRG